MKFTFFNVSNTEEVRAGTAKPQVNEVGPFIYREHRRKDDITTEDELISFGSYIAYEFDAEETSAACPGCTKETLVTVINPVMVIISDLLLQFELILPEVIHIPEITVPINGINITFPANDLHREDELELKEEVRDDDHDGVDDSDEGLLGAARTGGRSLLSIKLIGYVASKRDELILGSDVIFSSVFSVDERPHFIYLRFC